MHILEVFLVCKGRAEAKDSRVSAKVKDSIVILTNNAFLVFVNLNNSQ